MNSGRCYFHSVINGNLYISKMLKSLKVPHYLTLNENAVKRYHLYSNDRLCMVSAFSYLKNMDINKNIFKNHVRSITIQKSYLLNVRKLFKQNFERSIWNRQFIDNNDNMQSHVYVRAFSNVSNSGNSLNPQEFEPVKNEFSDRLNKAPKNVLHNIFDVVAQELDNRDIKLQPCYTFIKGKSSIHSWCCVYNIKWPELMKFVAMGNTKQEASHKAALSVLFWLRKKEKITQYGQPIIIDKRNEAKLTKESVPVLSVHKESIEEMHKIVNIFEDRFIPLLANNFTKNNSEKNLSVLEDNTEVSIPNYKKIKQIHLPRNKYFAKEKMKLPITEYKEPFINLLKENRVVIVKGEPGCGKSTRIPQYLLESWARDGLRDTEPFCAVVTQPRRIAAISLAQRVANERDERIAQVVGYQVRLKSNFNPSIGRILYCTTGILLRHLQTDLTLPNFTHVILDEAHERDVNTDLLMNLLRTALKTNLNLKLIVMSATIDTSLFKEYFAGAPVLHVPGFTYPVKSYFLDDIKLDLKKTLKISDAAESPTVNHEEVAKVIEYVHKKKPEGAILCFLPGWEDISKLEKLIPRSNDLMVLRLHSKLQDTDQYKIFSKAPPGVRKIILSTNIAETSVTIDDVVYMIDTGIHKENRFDNERGVGCIDNHWISQSSMVQRKGRAGRVQSGESFHLYKKNRFDSFKEFTDPEILRTSLTKIILDAKVYSNNMDALEFMNSLPTPPEKAATRRAVRELKDLQLLDEHELLTPLGKTLANFQLEPKLAKVLVNAVVYKCVTPVVDIVTIFSADTELFANSLLDKDSIKQLKTKGCKYSDHLAMMRIFETWLEHMDGQGSDGAQNYCHNNNLVHHKLVTLSKLRQIHFDYIYKGLKESLPISDKYSDNDELVKSVLLSGVGTLLKHQNWNIVKGRLKKSNVFLTNYSQRATLSLESVNSKRSSFPSDLLVYLNEVRSNIRRTTVIRESSVISPLAVLLFSDKELVSKTIENGKVLLGLKDTKIEFLCMKEEALLICKCKEALESAYNYFIFQMTDSGEFNEGINETWDNILDKVNAVLLKQTIK